MSSRHHIEIPSTVSQEVLALLGNVEKKLEEGEGDRDKQTKISEALEAVNKMKYIAPLIPDLVSGGLK